MVVGVVSVGLLTFRHRAAHSVLAETAGRADQVEGQFLLFSRPKPAQHSSKSGYTVNGKFRESGDRP
jgi:hypothetical protein